MLRFGGAPRATPADHDYTIDQFTNLSASEAARKIERLKFRGTHQTIAGGLVPEIQQRLLFMNLTIPSSSATNPPIKSSKVQIVSIDHSETIRFNNQVIDLKALTARLTELKQTNPDIAVVIRPDRDLPVQKLIALMDALKQAQITKLGIATKAESK